MDANNLRKSFIDYFRKQGHAIVRSSSLLPDNDPSVLLTTAGMQQFKPYFLGQRDAVKDFGSKRLASIQKCFRTTDIEPIGDESHNTFFEMLGNFSIGDYFKAEAINWAWDFLVKRLGLDQKRLWATYFAGDENAGPDKEAEKLWRAYLPKERILPFGRETNWWGPPGKTGSCGPSSEIHFDRTEKPCSAGSECRPNCDCNRFIELWNLVFTEYEKTSAGKFKPLPSKSIDTGLGLERLAMAVQGAETIFQTDLFIGIVKAIEHHHSFGSLENSEENVRRLRIVADHLRGAVFLLNDGVQFSNKTTGYILRRIVRRAIDQFSQSVIDFRPIVEAVGQVYRPVYPELSGNVNAINVILQRELSIYQRVLKADVAAVYTRLKRKSEVKEKTDMPPAITETPGQPSVRQITAAEAFRLYATYGFSVEQLKREGFSFDEAEFKNALAEHQKISRVSQGLFQGGLADHEPNTIRGHTATHLLQQALREVLGPDVIQKGSNVTADRIRFDFPHQEKLTTEEIQRVEKIVNERIRDDLIVYKKSMSIDEAKKIGAIGAFEEKYGDMASVYLIGSDEPSLAYSKEFCGGPHVGRTGEIGSFKIIREESSSSGIRRIRAIVGPSVGKL